MPNFIVNSIICPNCEPHTKSELECTTSDYSGTGVDIGVCPECGKCWQVSYVVGELNWLPELDQLPREIREEIMAKEERLRKEAEELLERKKYEILKAKYEGSHNA